MKHDLESLLEQIDFSSFLSLARIITFSPPRTRSKPLVSKPFIISLHSLYKFHVTCFVFSHFNSLSPASLSLVQLRFSWLSNSFSFNLHKMSLRYQFTISSQAPIIWKDSLFITSVWRFFAANGKSVFIVITIVATDEELHSCRIHNIRIDTTVNSYEGTTRHRAFV